MDAERERSLSGRDLELLRSVGVETAIDSDTAEATHRRQVQKLAQRIDRLVASSHTVADYAAATRQSEEQVRAQIQARELWTFVVDDEARVPGIAVHRGRPLPGLATIAPRLPEGMHPVAVEGLLTTPNPDLVIAGDAVSILEWLRAGLPPKAAADATGEPFRGRG